MMEAHILWQNASAPEPFRTQKEVAVLGILAERMGTTEVEAQVVSEAPTGRSTRLIVTEHGISYGGRPRGETECPYES